MALFISSFSYSAGESISRNRAIKEVLVYEGTVVVKIDPVFENSQDCTSGSQKWLQLDYNSETGKNQGLLSTILAAAAASKKVGFGINGCTGQYPEIYRVDVVF
ncbi:MAG: hypothetical protein K6L80_16365 [Agarilytica sp.]